MWKNAESRIASIVLPGIRDNQGPVVQKPATLTPRGNLKFKGNYPASCLQAWKFPSEILYGSIVVLLSVVLK